MQIPIFLNKESYYVKKLYKFIFKNIDDYHVTLKKLIYSKKLIYHYLSLFRYNHTTFIWNIFSRYFRIL